MGEESSHRIIMRIPTCPVRSATAPGAGTQVLPMWCPATLGPQPYAVLLDITTASRPLSVNSAGVTLVERNPIHLSTYQLRETCIPAGAQSPWWGPGFDSEQVTPYKGL